MSEEFTALQRQGTWSLVPPPKNSNILGCRWTFRTKLKPDGTLDRHKARLVAQGFKQEYDIDYKETFSPLPKFLLFASWLLLHFIEVGQFSSSMFQMLFYMADYKKKYI
ncbi:uncharacterized protein LOC110092248 [Dendrobium catenatum]|uniref:uncharacterized protein LOC110092248 n=1 Tax=Dendrobium catenatum TaxID=906689 RepID=UPI0009F2BE19|nr:uncharacterized protein LOC110092248 [Dendrobium catenatum]